MSARTPSSILFTRFIIQLVLSDFRNALLEQRFIFLSSQNALLRMLQKFLLFLQHFLVVVFVLSLLF